MIVVAQSKDGIWMTNERGPARVAIAYFPTKYKALRHAVGSAKARARCRVEVRNRTGACTASRDYEQPFRPSLAHIHDCDCNTSPHKPTCAIYR